ncbi:MAG: HypC/HybG/HupF family hydrogenase formation chaperone [Thermoplasmata archaeon HGW-Thermoplasmata-1]|nr:MAG: HypC/HybG/HupF family hydrogenase formation chaperone [Thermoplasmata archaeon HGW-Thermoplasmata-1]
MCLAVPARVLSITGDKALVDYGDGTRREANISLIKAVSKGEYVIVHAGYAIQKLSVREALETLKLFQEMLDADAGA